MFALAVGASVPIPILLVANKKILEPPIVIGIAELSVLFLASRNVP
jgi:hypothetical protein